MKSSRWLIASNRLPFNKDSKTGELIPSSGGLVSAINGIKSNAETFWIGALPPDISPEEWKEKSAAQHQNYIPVFVPKRTYEGYYNGMANNVFWPLFHYESNIVRFKWSDWSLYRRVNEKFAEEIVKIAKPNDLIWVHDFHLMLLPQFLKKKNKKLKVGFFLHIPFPSSEIFRQLPVRRQVLEGLLASDLIGFHDYSYLRHFCTSLDLILGLDSTLLNVRKGNREVQLGVFPVSIDTNKFKKQAEALSVRRRARHLRKQHGIESLILGVDRLDYIKGIELKFYAFREMLKRFPQLRGKVSLLQIAVPSRAKVPEYVKLKANLDRLVGEINGEFGTPDYIPVQYLYSSVDFKELLALYRASDILLITSRRDGMNLVALEFIASQDAGNPGVVLLSEFTGAISTLSHVVPINPWDTVTLAETIAETINLPKKDRRQKNAMMLKYLREYTATDWGGSYMQALEGATRTQDVNPKIEIRTTSSNAILPPDLRQKISRGPVVLMMDYDGTLVPIHEHPADAIISNETRKILSKLQNKKSVQLVVVSGRDSRFLSEQFSDLNISIAAEHGAKFYDPRKKKWESLVHTNRQSWYPFAQTVMVDYAKRVPESFVEKKDFSISWHYRRSPVEFARYQARKLKEELELGLSNSPVTILAGKKIIEARTVEANKGTFARWYVDTHLQTEKIETMIGVGDDQTDEDLFNSIPADGITVKVGEGATLAAYRLADQKGVFPLLNKLVEICS